MANGMQVVLPAPGGACTTARLLARKHNINSDKISLIGKLILNVMSILMAHVTTRANTGHFLAGFSQKEQA